MARLCYPHLHQYPMEELWINQSTLTSLPLPCYCLPLLASTCRAQQSSVWFIWGCLLRNGKVMSAFKEERLKYLYKPSNVFITALLDPFLVHSQGEWSIPCVSSTPVGTCSGYCHTKPAVPCSYKLRFCIQQPRVFLFSALHLLLRLSSSSVCLLAWPLPHLTLA